MSLVPLDELFEIDINGKQLEKCNTVKVGIFELSSSEAVASKLQL